jgi:2'-5' RNA ligase
VGLRRHGQTSPVRLFVAVALPAPIVELLEALPRPEARAVRWTTPAQWHITLRFLGEVDELTGVTDAVHGLAGRFDTGDIEARLGPESRWFPGRRVLRVPVAGLDALAGRVRALTARWGEDDEPGFSGHVTLARARGRGGGPPHLAGVPVEGRFDVARVGVFASTLGTGNASYEALADVPIVRSHPA